MSTSPIPDLGRFHYVGAAGSGMSALAQFQALRGRLGADGQVSGSDREFDRGGATEVRTKLEALGIRLYPQDGSGVEKGLAGVVVSTAVEESIPDVQRARTLGIPVFHRSELLARWVTQFETVAVTGTSGKSTVTAMIFEILKADGRSPSIITGAALVSLQEEGLLGNASAGTSDILVIEADESDGSLTAYHPALGVFLNLSKDHKPTAEVSAFFEKFWSQCDVTLVNGGDPGFESYRSEAQSFGFSGVDDFNAENVRVEPSGGRFSIEGTEFFIPLPGRCNIENALAAVAAASMHGVSLEVAAAALKRFKGVARRFQLLGETRGVRVIDDFAHNPVKIRAALEAVRPSAQRVIAVFQPHGYGPTRFLKDDLIAAFKSSLASHDLLLMPEIYYAGGSAQKDISSADLIAPLQKAHFNARFFPVRAEIPAFVAAEAKAGDVVLVMGARDPGLPAFGRDILKALGGA